MPEWICEQCGIVFERKSGGKDKKPRFCGQPCYRLWREENNMAGGQFVKGSIPWNKGMKGIHMSPATEFKRGSVSANKLPVGSVTIRTRKRDNRQRAWVKIAEPSVWKPRALVVWEEHNGPIPKGHVIHKIDDDPLNDDIGNLSMVTRAEHMVMHRPGFEDKRRENSSVALKQHWKNYRENKKERNEAEYDVYYWQMELEFDEARRCT